MHHAMMSSVGATAWEMADAKRGEKTCWLVWKRFPCSTLQADFLGDPSFLQQLKPPPQEA